MKKAYSKPEIVFESFSLSTNIAGNCEYLKEDPRLYFEGVGYVFLENICDWPVRTVGGDGDYNGICYYIPTQGAPNVFAS